MYKRQLFDEAGSVHHLRARHARTHAEEWLAQLVQALRERRIRAAEGSAMEVMAHHRDREGRLLPPRVAAVELLNLLRPTVAVSVFVVFAAHAMHQHPQCLAALQAGDERYTHWFVQEVRRFYPFFPAVIARAREEFEWRGIGFRQGQRVMLDLYGTNHDPRSWREPQQFRPERFRDETVTAFNFVPQGGGDPAEHHRCPGEGVALAVMKVSVDYLARRLGYEVPPQDLRVDFQRLPAVPRSHFLMRDVTPLPQHTWQSFAFSPS